MEFKLCVKCGRCLSVCPTYLATLDEKLSPRGRLALIEAREAGRVEADPTYRLSLTGCLGCGRCEESCANEILVRPQVRADRSLLPDLLTRLSADDMEPHVQATLSTMGLIHSPSGIPPQEILEEPVGPRDGPGLVLFPGCVLAGERPREVIAVAQALARAGYRVALPEEPVCCGQPAIWFGRAEAAAEAIEKAGAAIGRAAKRLDEPQGVVFLCGSCGERLTGSVEPDSAGAGEWLSRAGVGPGGVEIPIPNPLGGECVSEYLLQTLLPEIAKSLAGSREKA